MNLTILGFMGESGSGKDLCAKWFVDNKGFTRVGFTDVFKRFCADVFGFSEEQLWGDPEHRNREVIPCSFGMADSKDAYRHWQQARKNFTTLVHTWVQELEMTAIEKTGYVHVLKDWLAECEMRAESGAISPRLVLQLLGAEYGNRYKGDIWTDYLYKKTLPQFDEGSKVVIADHRYLREIRATQKHGGHVVKVLRLSHGGKPNEAEVHGISGHETETRQRQIPDEAFDLILHLEEGVDKVHQRLQKMYEDREWEKS